MKVLALWAALVFAGSPVLAKVCALRCAGSAASSQAAAHSHCGADPHPSPDPKSRDCGHGHRGEALLTSAPASKVLLAPAQIGPDGSRTTLLEPSARRTVSVFPFESPPLTLRISVLRL